MEEEGRESRRNAEEKEAGEIQSVRGTQLAAAGFEDEGKDHEPRNVGSFQKQKKPSDDKQMGTSALQQQETEFCQQLKHIRKQNLLYNLQKQLYHANIFI